MMAKKEWMITNADLNQVGVDELDYDWNDICDWISESGIHGQDGSSYINLERVHPGDTWVKSEKLAKIINHIFDKIKEETGEEVEILMCYDD